MVYVYLMVANSREGNIAATALRKKGVVFESVPLPTDMRCLTDTGILITDTKNGVSYMTVERFLRGYV